MMAASDAPCRLPHGEPARFVEEILERPADGIVCRARISAASPWAAGGLAPATAGLEIAAQAAAWLEALERAEGAADAASEGAAGDRRIGYLVRVRRASLGAAIPLGASVVARVQRAGGVPPLAIYEVEVRLEDAGEEDSGRVCTGTLGTYLTGDSIPEASPG